MLSLTLEQLLELGIPTAVMAYLIVYMTRNITQKLDLIISKLDELKSG